MRIAKVTSALSSVDGEEESIVTVTGKLEEVSGPTPGKGIVGKTLHFLLGVAPNKVEIGSAVTAADGTASFDYTIAVLDLIFTIKYNGD